MPPLYGEGWNSFLRLQEVILERTQDLSVFAWKPLDKIQTCRGALARSPAEFAWCKSIFTLNFSSEADDFALTGSGLRITTQILEDRQLGKKQVNDLPHSHLILGLNCATLSASDGSLPGGKIGIILRKVGERLFLRDLTSSGGIRLDNKLDWGKSKDEWLPQQNINIPRDVSAPQSLRYNKTRAFGVFFHIAGGLKVVQAMPPLRWDPSLRAFIPGTMHATRALVIRPNKVNDDADDFVVIITEMGIMGKLFSLARSEVPEVPNAACMLNSIYVILRRHPNAKIILENISNLHEGDIQHYLQHRALKMEPTRPGQAGPAVSLPWPALEAQRKGTVELPCGVINLARGRCDIQALMLGDEIGVDCIAILPLEANEQGEGNEQGEKDQTQDLNSSAFSGSGLNEDRHHETENIWKNLGHCPNTDRPDPSTAAPTLYQMILVANADNLLTTWASSTSCTARLMTLLLVTNSRP
jgi:hypothetical protein